MDNGHRRMAIEGILNDPEASSVPEPRDPPSSPPPLRCDSDMAPPLAREGQDNDQSGRSGVPHRQQSDDVNEVGCGRLSHGVAWPVSTSAHHSSLGDNRRDTLRSTSTDSAGERGALALMSMSDVSTITISLRQTGLTLRLLNGDQFIPQPETQASLLRVLVLALPLYADELLALNRVNLATRTQMSGPIGAFSPSLNGARNSAGRASGRSDVTECDADLPQLHDLTSGGYFGSVDQTGSSTNAVDQMSATSHRNASYRPGHHLTSGLAFTPINPTGTSGSTFTPINRSRDDTEDEDNQPSPVLPVVRRNITAIRNPRTNLHPADLDELLPSCISLHTGYDPSPRGADTFPPGSREAIRYHNYRFFCDHPDNDENTPCDIQLRDHNYDIERTCVADCFGRNKVETKAIPRKLRYCRKHYQKVSYRKGRWLKHRVEMVKRQIEMLHYDRPTIRFRVQLRSTKLRELERVYANLQAIHARLGDIRQAIMDETFVPLIDDFLINDQKCTLLLNSEAREEAFTTMKDHYANFLINEYHTTEHVHPDTCLMICNLIARMIKCRILKAFDGVEFLPELDAQLNRIHRPRTTHRTRSQWDPSSQAGPSSDSTADPASSNGNDSPQASGSFSVLPSSHAGQSSPLGRLNLSSSPSALREQSSASDATPNHPRKRRQYGMVAVAPKDSKYPGYDTENDPYETDSAVDPDETEWEQKPEIEKPVQQIKRVKLTHKAAGKF
ncbi:hypothetical protein P152DRAFT_448136 [Eremomyces bilateralis CBS 781.70]|uniref:Uncharacterized protein n=1 Tax=Eremomyces bilateralis CBS 781.70 TaxID=1392243 RepID=A0A6G1G6K8_9PEZI|nr:uncharacterized protein P152DRAFT_448136 [Eremomyces bilateralis CBS 781.70]KAF1813725.1 hypothetical protein P152DRAFT_448136 [Eremomyces bilateralis CBS 781.70]